MRTEAEVGVHFDQTAGDSARRRPKMHSDPDSLTA